MCIILQVAVVYVPTLLLYFPFDWYLYWQVVAWCYNVWDACWLSSILHRRSNINMQEGQYAFWIFLALLYYITDNTWYVQSFNLTLWWILTSLGNPCLRWDLHLSKSLNHLYSVTFFNLLYLCIAGGTVKATVLSAGMSLIDLPCPSHPIRVALQL